MGSETGATLMYTPCSGRVCNSVGAVLPVGAEKHPREHEVLPNPPWSCANHGLRNWVPPQRCCVLVYLNAKVPFRH